MKRILGLPVDEAILECEKEGVSFRLEEVSSRKGCEGNDARVISAVPEKNGYLVLTYANFLTEIKK